MNARYRMSHPSCDSEADVTDAEEMLDEQSPRGLMPCEVGDQPGGRLGTGRRFAAYVPNISMASAIPPAPSCLNKCAQSASS